MANEDNKNIQFTGNPVAFDGVDGKRDPKAGKGRFDLIPTEVYYPLFKRAESNWFVDCHPASILMSIANEKFIDAIIQMTIYAYCDHIENHAIQSSAFWPCVWPMLQDLAIHFQKGAEHYGERNCQKGIPLWSFKDSAMRHAAQTFEGKDDEPHKISVIWNCWMAHWTVIQEKEKEGERMLLALERAAEASVNSALGDNLKEVVENLRDVRKKLKTERHNCTSDSARYDVMSKSIEELKHVINMLYSIAEQTNTPIVTAVQGYSQGEYVLTPDGELPVSHPGEEWKPAKQPVDVLIHSECEIPKAKRDELIKLCQALQDKLEKKTFDPNTSLDAYNKIIEEMSKTVKETGIPWPPKEPDVVPENEQPVSESIKVVMSSDYGGSDIDYIITAAGEKMSDTEWFGNQGNHRRMLHWFSPDELLNELIERVSEDQGFGQDYRAYSDLFHKLYCEFLTYVDARPVDTDYHRVIVCRCPTGALLEELYNRLSAINRSEKIVKQNFMVNNQDMMTKITQRVDAIKRGATGPIELPKVALQGGFNRCIPFPKSWDHIEDLESGKVVKVVDAVVIQQIISKLKEELERAHDIFADTDGSGVRVFFKHLRPTMNDMLAMWNSIAAMLLDEKTPEQ